MGTYSYFRLEIMDRKAKEVLKNENKHKIMQSLFDDADLSQDSYIQMALAIDGSTNDEAKWYDYQQDLEVFSKKHPHLTFILGIKLCCPESDDFDGEYFISVRNGFTQHDIKEPEFMKAEPIFKDEAALRNAIKISEVDDETVSFQFFLNDDNQANDIVDQLFSTSLAEYIESIIYKDGYYTFSITLDPTRHDEFWSEVKRTLIK